MIMDRNPPARTPVRLTRSPFWHNLQVVLAAAAIACVWLVCLTFDSADWPSSKVYPHPETHNWLGGPGAWLAYQFFYFLGDGVWPLLVGASFLWWAGFRRWRIADLGLRVIGVLLLVAVTAAGVAWLVPVDEASLPEGNGGVLGIVLIDLARKHLTSFMTGAVLVCSFIVGVLLAADNVVTGVPSFWQRLLRWPRRGPMVPAVQPAPAMPVPTAAPEQAPNPPQPPAEVQQPKDVASRDLMPGVETAPPPEQQSIISIVRPILPEKVEQTAQRNSSEAWAPPPLSLLDEPEQSDAGQNDDLLRQKARLLDQALGDFHVDARVVSVDAGPVVTLFEVALAPGVKVSQVYNVATDLARALRTPSIRVVAPLPNKNTIGIELPNIERRKVRLKELLCMTGRHPVGAQLPLFLGMDAGGKPLVTDLAEMPHCLIAGTTGAGKSVCVNSLITSLLMTQPPEVVKLVLIDPKVVELGVYAHLPHLLCPVVTDHQKAVLALEWATRLMDERYTLLAEAGVRHIAAYNQRIAAETSAPPGNAEGASDRLLPYVVIVIDELADLMLVAAKAVEAHLCRLAQKSRAVGIHMIVATQRPEVKVITGLIKSNLPTRISFRVASSLDSRIILDQKGAETLLGRGDMLFLPMGTHKPTRVQGTFIGDDELRRVVDFLTTHGEPQFHPALLAVESPTMAE
jgi:S-DNA-T family DNA segregation ATPase FtsK/SpoIIIE